MKILPIRLTLALITFSMFSSSLYAVDIAVGSNAYSGGFPLFSNNIAAPIVVDENDAEVVKIVAQAFIGDVKLLTGIVPSIKTTLDTPFPVIVGTLGKSALIDQLATSGKINKSRLEGKWETFCISVVNSPMSGVDKALVIAGSDPRGTAFGVFELSRMMGVSPWSWWADVTPARREAIYISGDDVFGPPSVKYRGMFINDEDWGLQPWAAKNMDTSINNGKGDIGPKAYEKIFELMLRTKSNFLWPAMHACTKAFWYYNANPDVARRYSIVMGSAHCEPMLRNNEDEWRVNFATEYPGVTKGEWNWRTNSTVIKNYWIDRVKQSKNNDAVYTLGMRGVHDSQMLGYSTDKERAEALKTIIAAQREILQTYLEKPKESVPQLFCPYKEALLHYNQGINLPEDVTLLWPDDNHGYIRQLSDPTEQLRGGGGGVYYHFSYLGSPQDYLWLASTSPALISSEMSKAYALNARDIWVFNVGDIKPAEFEYQFAMDLSWDVNAWTPEKAHEYVHLWANEIFGSELADDISEIKTWYFDLAASVKPEHLHVATFSVAEIKKRLIDYSELVEKVKAVEPRVPERLKAAFFQLIAYPVQGAAAMNEKMLGAKLSFEYMNLGKTTEALEIADRSKEAYRTIRDLTYIYNKVNADGKWDGVMSYDPVGRSFFYDWDAVTAESIPNDTILPSAPDQVVEISAKNYITKSANVKVIEKLGVAGASVTVWPLDMTIYNASNITTAPNVEYKVQLKKGNNKITVKCLPTFPLYTALDLRYAISIGGGTPTFVSIKTAAENNDWGANVLRGYAKEDFFIKSVIDKEISVKVYFADPGLVVSALQITSIYDESSASSISLVNPDFEYDINGNQLTGTTRGTPYGWTQTGTLSGNSWGTSQDAANYHGQNVCWYNSTPMPANFELSQIVKGLPLPTGEYILRCKMAVPQDKMTNQRLFANKYVKYFGRESNYVSNLTSGEINSFAGYIDDSGSGLNILLKEVALKFILVAGEELKIGLRSSNKNSDGTTTATDNSGWFKVDHFRLELVRELTLQDVKAELEGLIRGAQQLYSSTKEGSNGGDYPQQARTTFQSGIQAAQSVNQNSSASITQLIAAIDNLKKEISVYKKRVISFSAFIRNANFEYKSEGVLNDGTTLRGTPYGWSNTGITGNSFGINSDANGIDGKNVCWYLSSPMPANFELYQQLTGLFAGEYTVRCKLTVPNGQLTTQRLFANNNVQYYGYQADYGVNMPEGEEKTFASWSTSGNYTLQEMKVDVNLSEGELLKLGVRTSNKLADGSVATGTAGWFKVDNFRLELQEPENQTSLEKVDEDFFQIIGERGACVVNFKERIDSAHVRIISLSGVVVYNQKIKQQNTRIALPRGLYVILIALDDKGKSCKVLVK